MFLKTVATIFIFVSFFMVVGVGLLYFTGARPPAFAEEMTKVIISDEATKEFDSKFGAMLQEARQYNEEQAKNVKATLTAEEISSKMTSLASTGSGPLPLKDIQVNLQKERILMTGHLDLPFSMVRVGVSARVQDFEGKSQVEIEDITIGSVPLPGMIRERLSEHLLSVNLFGVNPPVTLRDVKIENNQFIFESKKVVAQKR